MNAIAQNPTDVPFDASRRCFERLIESLEGAEMRSKTHSDVEAFLAIEGRELLRSLLQDYLDERAVREVRQPEIIAADGSVHGRVERNHERTLTTVFGDVGVRRLAYRQPGARNLYPQDLELNLPAEQYSHGIRQLAPIESTRGSYDGAVTAIKRSTGVRLGKRQLGLLTLLAAADFEKFYEQRTPPVAFSSDLLVLSVDGKGIVMRPESLRPGTQARAEASTHKLQTRLSRGEKRNSKRMATVAAVYDQPPFPRTASQVMARSDGVTGSKLEKPRLRSKWLVASIEHDMADVIAQVFDEADRRDPLHLRTCVVLVDGARPLIRGMEAEAARRGIDAHIIVDFVHVLEYLWSASWCFFAEGSPDAEKWVQEQALCVLEGKAKVVAAAMRRKATCRNLSKSARKKVDIAARYLHNQSPYLRYDHDLKAGFPIATGVIEGACRHLIKDRMALTGARWGLEGAEAILKLRALISNRDFEAYWSFHLRCEQQRVHCSRYASCSANMND